MNPIRWRRSPRDTEDVPGSAERDPTGIILIDCHGCGRNPDPCGQDCISCMASAVHTEGSSERIRMSSGRDVEVVGRSAAAICRLSELLNAAVTDPKEPECRDCECRPTAVMDVLWEDFPEPSFQQANQLLRRVPTDNPGCSSCIQRTSALVVNAEKQMASIRSELGGGYI